jgi:prephenate dehydrogenase
VGSHPMAGSERGGFAAARADLFDGATVIVTPTKQTHRDAERRAGEFWTALGANLAILAPEIHDRMVAAVSHIPHLMAAALVNHAVKFGDLNLAAGGFRDATRIASGSPELWTEILWANAEAVRFQVSQLIAQLSEFEGALQNPDSISAKSALLATLKAANDARSQLPARRSKRT